MPDPEADQAPNIDGIVPWHQPFLGGKRDIDLWGDLTDSIMFARLRLGGLQPNVKCQDLTPRDAGAV